MNRMDITLISWRITDLSTRGGHGIDFAHVPLFKYQGVMGGLCVQVQNNHILRILDIYLLLTENFLTSCIQN